MIDTSEAVVAVITTCYDQEEYIGRTMESVIAQNTDAKVYHVICDDGSTDNSLAVLRDWEARYPHIRVLSVTNRNMAGAFNACMMALPNEVEFVVLIAGDDWLHPDFVEECLSALTPDTHMVVPAMKRVDYPGHRQFEREMPRRDNPTLDEVWEWETTYAWGVALYRRSVLVEAGGWHPLTGGDCDWDMWIDLVARGYRFAYAPAACFFYRYVANSMNRTKTKQIWDDTRREMQRHHRRNTLPGPEFS